MSKVITTFCNNCGRVIVSNPWLTVHSDFDDDDVDICSQKCARQYCAKLRVSQIPEEIDLLDYQLDAVNKLISYLVRENAHYGKH